jgi:hypothetical protein
MKTYEAAEVQGSFPHKVLVAFTSGSSLARRRGAGCGDPGELDTHLLSG